MDRMGRLDKMGNLGVRGGLGNPGRMGRGRGFYRMGRIGSFTPRMGGGV